VMPRRPPFQRRLLLPRIFLHPLLPTGFHRLTMPRSSRTTPTSSR
jgi:hypothetical protein